MRAWFDGAGWYGGIAAVLLLFTLLMVLLDLQSNDRLLWTGARATGYEQGGIVTYRWQGQNYSIDVPGYGSAQQVAVYLDPANPTNALPDSLPSRALDVALIGVPFGAALVLIGLGPVRNHRRRRRRTVRGGYGGGLDEDFIAARLDELRRGNRG